MHSGSTLSHRRFYNMNHISMTCRFSHSRLSWSPLEPLYLWLNYVISTPKLPNESWEPQCHPYDDLAFQGVLCPHWALRAIKFLSNMHLTLLCPRWALGATIWTTCIASYFRAFQVSNDPWEPIYIYIYIYIYAGWWLRFTLTFGSHSIIHLTNLTIQGVLFELRKTKDFRLSGSPVSPSSLYLNHKSTACRLSHSGPSPQLSHRSHYIMHMEVEPLKVSYVPIKPLEPLYIKVISKPSWLFCILSDPLGPL